MSDLGRHSKTSLHLWRFAALLAGLAITYYTIASFGGFAAIWDELKRLSPWTYAWVLANSVLWTLSYTKGWQLLMHDEKHRIRFLGLFKVKVSGEAVNFLTPAGFIVGDPVRIMLLKKYFGPAARMRSVVVDRALHSLSAQFYCLLAFLLVFTQDVPFPRWMSVSLIAIYFAVFLAVGSFIWTMVSGKGFGRFGKFFRRIRMHERFPRIEAKMVELRRELEVYAGESKTPFVFSFFCHFFGRALGAVEIAVIFYGLTGRFEWVFCAILTALTSFVAVVGGFVPGSAGFLEALYAAFAKLYGFEPAMGITIQLVRRLRVLFWIAAGMLVADYAEINDEIAALRHKSHDGKRREG
jgi:uncharacterized protein (TIRG00374 family)